MHLRPVSRIIHTLPVGAFCRLDLEKILRSESRRSWPRPRPVRPSSLRNTSLTYHTVTQPVAGHAARLKRREGRGVSRDAAREIADPPVAAAAHPRGGTGKQIAAGRTEAGSGGTTWQLRGLRGLPPLPGPAVRTRGRDPGRAHRLGHGLDPRQDAGERARSQIASPIPRGARANRWEPS